MSDSHIRVRIGVRLSWPIANAGIFVIYVPQSMFDKMGNAMKTLKALLVASGHVRIANKLVLEAS